MLNMPGGPEVVVILLVALIVLGPDQLPKAMRTLGQAMAEIRKVSSGFQNEMRNVMDTIDTTAKDAITTKPSASKPASSTDDVTATNGHVEEVAARNDAPRPSDTDVVMGPEDKPPSTSWPSAADRAAG